MYGASEYNNLVKPMLKPTLFELCLFIFAILRTRLAYIFVSLQNGYKYTLMAH